MTNQSLAERIRINQTGRIVDKAQAARAEKARNLLGPDTDIGLGDQSQKADDEIKLGEGFSTKLAEQFEAVKKYQLETVPRETVLRLFIEKKMDEHFSFKTQKGQGGNYVQAMRQILSRTRKKALKKKQPLNEFKLLTVSITEQVDHDVVVLVRTKHMTDHEQSVYDDLMKAMAKETVVLK